MPVSDQPPYIEVLLACGNTILVDEVDVHLVAARKWRYRASPSQPQNYAYVTANTDTKQLYLHREIMNCPKGMVVDHKDGNRLDNRRSNLRVATGTQNMRNRRKHRDGIDSRFKGVCRTRNGKWRAAIRNGTRQIHLGTFEAEAEAAYAYDTASLELHGEFGSRNFLPLA